jgi:hypothetical protein
MAAIDGNSTRDFEFYDDEHNVRFKVTLLVKDGLYFKLLERIDKTIQRLVK